MKLEFDHHQKCHKCHLVNISCQFCNFLCVEQISCCWIPFQSSVLMLGHLFKFDGPEAPNPDERADDVSEDGSKQLKLLTRYSLKAIVMVF